MQTCLGGLRGLHILWELVPPAALGSVRGRHELHRRTTILRSYAMSQAPFPLTTGLFRQYTLQGVTDDSWRSTEALRSLLVSSTDQTSPGRGSGSIGITILAMTINGDEYVDVEIGCHEVKSSFLGPSPNEI